MTPVFKEAEEHRDDEMRPYRKLYASVIALAVKDVKHGACVSRGKAAWWLLHSNTAALMLDACGIDAARFRQELLAKPWFRDAARASARLLNPLFRAA